MKPQVASSRKHLQPVPDEEIVVRIGNFVQRGTIDKPQGSDRDSNKVGVEKESSVALDTLACKMVGSATMRSSANLAFNILIITPALRILIVLLISVPKGMKQSHFGSSSMVTS